MRISQAQRQRTKENPLVLGPFSELSIRNLKGSLGPKNRVVGRSDRDWETRIIVALFFFILLWNFFSFFWANDCFLKVGLLERIAVTALRITH